MFRSRYVAALALVLYADAATSTLHLGNATSEAAYISKECQAVFARNREISQSKRPENIDAMVDLILDMYKSKNIARKREDIVREVQRAVGSVQLEPVPYDCTVSS